MRANTFTLCATIPTRKAKVSKSSLQEMGLAVDFKDGIQKNTKHLLAMSSPASQPQD